MIEPVSLPALRVHDGRARSVQRSDAMANGRFDEKGPLIGDVARRTQLLIRVARRKLRAASLPKRLNRWSSRYIRRSCLVLSINLIHCGNEFQNSVPVRTYQEEDMPKRVEVPCAAGSAIAAFGNRGGK